MTEHFIMTIVVEFLTSSKMSSPKFQLNSFWKFVLVSVVFRAKVPETVKFSFNDFKSNVNHSVCGLLELVSAVLQVNNSPTQSFFIFGPNCLFYWESKRAASKFSNYLNRKFSSQTCVT